MDAATLRAVDAAILRAVERLTDLGTGGSIDIRGRFFRDVLHDKNNIFTEQIPDERLADYRWFDILDDSLFRGLGLAWGENRMELYYPQGDESHFRFVSVRRADLLAKFPEETIVPQDADKPSISGRAPAVKKGRAPDDETILAKADEMKKRGLLGYQIASSMRHEPGFENVMTVQVRALLKGRYPSGRPKKS